ncbi:protein FAR1-RELATED SEQUENCE 5-like [Coffea eugenioides]|uniref:protein FAR1-RELATED SEQUENCE 5-like n=1 Tax=Coffea eugenioides TaxID=49369 RepID=UPI000F6119E8|nr:protein FAR1-RELATED SEQUENCE 5-like [Coffea eugenioides]
MEEALCPKIGMEFQSEDEAYNFYNRYGLVLGFSVRGDYLNKDKDGVVTSRRKVSISQGAQAEIANDAGISLKQSHELMGKETSRLGNIGYTRDDLKRYLRRKREGIKKTNKEYRPLGVFVGFNQFRQLIIFKATLLYDETIESFKWVFGTFVEAVCEKHPKTIFTDQDAALTATISAVMPSTYHGLCTFHIRVNFMKHIGNYYKDGSNLPNRFAECMYEIEDENEFIMAWDAMLKEHKLETNEWLRGIYAYRKKWAKCFMKGAWTARMRSTQLSESLNASIKKYLKLDHDLVQFFKLFNRVVDEKRYNELRIEYHSRQKLPMLGLQQTPVLIQAASIYSPSMFVAFQNEYDESTTMVILDQKHTTMHVEYSVSKYVGGRERRVTLNPITKDITCSCNLFEQEGILCSHALKVYDMVGTKFIPA